jgi:hypothetical protein
LSGAAIRVRARAPARSPRPRSLVLEIVKFFDYNEGPPLSFDDDYGQFV